VYAAYGVYHDKSEVTDDGGAYFMSHTSSTYVFDREGKWRLVLPYGTDIKDVVHDIRLLLE
jgi:protein SCO1/2